MSAASIGGLQHALPTGLNPIVTQEMALKQQQLKISQQEVGIEGYNAQTNRQRLGLEEERAKQETERLAIEDQRYAATAAKADAAAKTEENKEFFQNFQALAMLKKSGAKIPDEVMQSYTAELATRSGLDVKEAKSWFEYITGGSHYEYSPKPDSGLASQAAGPTSGQKLTHLQQVAKQRAAGQTN
jgi:hypothetical protein